MKSPKKKRIYISHAIFRTKIFTKKNFINTPNLSNLGLIPLRFPCFSHGYAIFWISPLPLIFGLLQSLIKFCPLESFLPQDEDHLEKVIKQILIHFILIIRIYWIGNLTFVLPISCKTTFNGVSTPSLSVVS